MTESEQTAREEAAATARSELEARAKRGTAYQIMAAVARGHTLESWLDINPMLHSTLWFIVQTVKPAMHPMEIGLIYNDFNGGHWFGENGGESLYAMAIRVGHPSAVVSIERWLRREPFWIEEEGEKRRLYIGRVFTHEGERLRVTSFFEHGVQCVRDDEGAKAGVVELVREGLEAARAAVRQARLDKAKAEREASRADPVPFKSLRHHLEQEVHKMGRRSYRSEYVPPEYLTFADEHKGDYKAAYNAIPCTHALGWYLEAIGMRSDRRCNADTADALRKNYPWSKVEQHLFRELRRIRGLPLRDAKAAP